jgi:predicted N-acetyltransferase YhbS
MVEIRALKEEDRGHVRALELFCVREYLESALKKNWDTLSQDLIDQLGASAKGSFDFYRDAGLSYVAVEDNQIVGFIFSQMVEHVFNVDKVVWIEGLMVHPMQRRKGIGFKLLRKVAAEGKKKGAKAVQSVVLQDSQSVIMLHKKVGFFIDGRKLAFLDLESYS